MWQEAERSSASCFVDGTLEMHLRDDFRFLQHDHGGFLMNVVSGSCLGVNHTGAMIIAIISQGGVDDVEALLAVLASRHQGEREQMIEDTRTYVVQLERAGVIGLD
ncbi:PqqD family protein [Luteitalea sp.]